MIVRWGHFSDLHFKGWDGFETADLRLTLPEALTKEKIKFDYMFITGDISHKGEFDSETKDFINEIANVTECKAKNIIICPGNHDGKRYEIRKVLLDIVISKREKDKSAEMDDYTRESLIDTPFKGFVEAHEAITGGKPESLLDYARELKGINLYVLNTAVFAGQTYPRKEPWSSEDEIKEDHNLYLTDSKLIELRKNTKTMGFSNNNLNIVIGHHGIECFVEEEQNNLRTFFRNQKIDLYLCGHVHKNSNDEVSKATDTKQVSCGGLFYNDHTETSFIYGELETDTNEVKLYNYYYDKKPQWVLNLAASDPYDRGIHHYNPPRIARSPVSKSFPTAVSVLDSNALYSLAEQRYEQGNTSPSKSIIRAIKKDIEDVKDHFYGYSIELEKLKTAMSHNGYVYVHGQQLFGKTFLMLKAVYDISTQDAFSADFSAHPIPWIHKCFLVIGKRASSKDRGIEMLIEQANMVLNDPVDLERKDYDKYGFNSIMQKLSKELSHVTVIFDALDEMVMDDFELFTEPLPDNCTVIFSRVYPIIDKMHKKY